MMLEGMTPGTTARIEVKGWKELLQKALKP
jgi:hypothetical protein